MGSHVEQEIGLVAKVMYQRRKAVAAAFVTIVGALAQLFPSGQGLHLLVGLATFLVATGAVHAVPNVDPPLKVTTDAVGEVAGDVSGDAIQVVGGAEDALSAVVDDVTKTNPEH